MKSTLTIFLFVVVFVAGGLYISNLTGYSPFTSYTPSSSDLTEFDDDIDPRAEHQVYFGDTSIMTYDDVTRSFALDNCQAQYDVNEDMQKLGTVVTCVWDGQEISRIPADAPKQIDLGDQ